MNRLPLYRSLREIFSVLLVFQIVCCFANTDTPLAVVKSESMEPTLFRGDVIVIRNYSNANVTPRIGTIIVFDLPTKDIPIVHRIIKNTQDCIVTKGDNNRLDDRYGIYPKGMDCVPVKDIHGYVQLVIPFVGYLPLIIGEAGKSVKAILIVGMFLWNHSKDDDEHKKKKLSFDEKFVSRFLFTL